MALVEEMANPKADLGLESSNADPLPLLVNDGDGDAIAALAFIVGRIDADPTASLQGSLGDWAQWLEDEGYDVSSLVALFGQLVRSQAELAPAASELVASLAADQELKAVIRRFHDGAPALLDAVFAHLDHGADLHARLLGLSGGSRMNHEATSSLLTSIRTVKKIHREIDTGLHALESGKLLDLLPDHGGLLDQGARNVLSNPVFYVKEQNKEAGGPNPWGRQFQVDRRISNSSIDIKYSKGGKIEIYDVTIDSPKRTFVWQPGRDLVVETPRVSLSWEHREQLSFNAPKESAYWQRGQGGEIELPHLSATWGIYSGYYNFGVNIDVAGKTNVGIALYPRHGDSVDNVGYRGVNLTNGGFDVNVFSNGRGDGVSVVLFSPNRYRDYLISSTPGSSLEISNITADWWDY